MKLALAGETVLGGRAGERLAARAPSALIAEEVVAIAREADLLLLSLGCAISGHGRPRSDAQAPFLFCAPPAAAEVLSYLGVDCVTLASKHMLDFGVDALLDTFRYLEAAGIPWVGAGADGAAAWSPLMLERGGVSVGVVAVTDEPAQGAAGPHRPGVAFADLVDGPPAELLKIVGEISADVVVVAPRWGPSFVTAPVPHVQRAAAAFREAGAGLVAGCSAHSVHGVGDGILYSLGDFLRVAVTDPEASNDLGLLFLVTVDEGRPTRLEAVPLALDHCHTRLADPVETAWSARLFRSACAALGTTVGLGGGRLVVEWDRGDG
ncbi:CapA family protein [Pseudonocardia acidicola]|uniref:CapA family protein n=1 Tax=Pseudonocardia acidicola TaxID=2724939 RepID=A0ABX1SC77_9PSEU|nr:CapA family protein [Pseudonocardia acidicola]NMH99176.1 CapA family protein [Pseudonocardia acidicola]